MNSRHRMRSPSDEAHSLAYHWTMRAAVHRSEIFPLRSALGQNEKPPPPSVCQLPLGGADIGRRDPPRNKNWSALTFMVHGCADQGPSILSSTTMLSSESLQ